MIRGLDVRLDDPSKAPGGVRTTREGPSWNPNTKTSPGKFELGFSRGLERAAVVVSGIPSSAVVRHHQSLLTVPTKTTTYGDDTKPDINISSLYGDSG